MFNRAIDSRRRSCDLANLRVRDITHGNQVLPRAMAVQIKPNRTLQFELTEPNGASVAAWIEKRKPKPEQCLIPSRISKSPHFRHASMLGLSITGLPVFNPSG